MNLHLPNKCLIIFITVTAVVLLDQATKAGIASKMLLYDSSIIIEGLLNLTYVRNPGAAFGFLSHASPVFRSTFFILTTVSAIGLIFYYVAVSKEDESCLVFALSLILGGAAGNLIDRMRFGEVIDFIDVYWKTYHWPAFNVADAAISLGACIMIFEMLRRKKKGAATP
ncbi:MAG: signal peptidase II [Syntrophales bacterium]|nr:signal peptidase II [Syntrophales bacterium]